MSHARKGKVAHLPGKIREELNQRIYDGQTGKQLIKWLKGLKIPDAAAVSEQNISEWRKGGYVDWLSEEKRMDSIRRKAELAMRMAQAAGGSLGETIIAQLAGQIEERIESMTDEELAKAKPLLDTILQSEKLKLDRRKIDQKDEEIDITRKRFQRDTCELFIQWAADSKVQAIVEGSADKEVKMEQLVKVLFGERPATTEKGG